MNTTEVAMLGGVVPKKKRNGEVPNRNLRISLNIAAGGTGFLRHSSRKAELNWYFLQSDPMTAAVPVLFPRLILPKKGSHLFFARFVDKHAPVVLIAQYR